MNEEKVTAPRRYEPISRDHAKELVELMVKQFQPGEGAAWAELMKRSGMKESTYQRALDWCTEHEWLVGGGGRNLKYHLNPDGKWREALQPSFHTDLKAMEAKESPSSEASWGSGEGSKVDSIVALASDAIRYVDQKKN